MALAVARVRWTGQPAALAAYVGGLREDAHSDCRLLVAGRQFAAHRSVLASASAFFARIFSDRSCCCQDSSVVVLDGFQPYHVECILQFIYTGVTYVKNDRLAPVCKTAKALQIKQFLAFEFPSKIRLTNHEQATVAQINKLTEKVRFDSFPSNNRTLIAAKDHIKTVYQDVSAQNGRLARPPPLQYTISIPEYAKHLVPNKDIKLVQNSLEKVSNVKKEKTENLSQKSSHCGSYEVHQSSPMRAQPLLLEDKMKRSLSASTPKETIPFDYSQNSNSSRKVKCESLGIITNEMYENNRYILHRKIDKASPGVGKYSSPDRETKPLLLSMLLSNSQDSEGARVVPKISCSTGSDDPGAPLDLSRRPLHPPTHCAANIEQGLAADADAVAASGERSFAVKSECERSGDHPLETNESILSAAGTERNAAAPTARMEPVDDTLKLRVKVNRRNRERGLKCWEYLLVLLNDPKTNPSLICWKDREQGIFQLVKPHEIAKRWGTRICRYQKKKLTYDHFSRSLRYHYQKKTLEAVSEQNFMYKFGPRASSQFFCKTFRPRGI